MAKNKLFVKIKFENYPIYQGKIELDELEKKVIPNLRAKLK